MTPPQLHMHFELLLSAGMLPIRTVGEPGAHGAATTGTHGCGVNVPYLAAVAAATCGLAKELHMPKGKIFTIGLLSIIFAAGMTPAIVRLFGRTINVLGAAPKLHCKFAPPQTKNPTTTRPFY